MPQENAVRFAESAVDAKSIAVARIEEALREATGRTAADTVAATVKALKRALSAYQRNDWKEAAILAAEVADLDGTNSIAFHLLALALDNLGHMGKALEFYQQAVTLDPTDADIYLNVGLAAWKMEMLPQAEQAFRLYMELKPDCWKGYNNLGGALRDQGDLEGSVDLVRDAIYRMPEVPELWNTLGTIMTEMSDFKNAETFYAEALRLQPKAARVWHNRGYALQHTGPLDTALSFFDKADALNPAAGERIEIRHARGLCAAAAGELGRAWSDYEYRHDPGYRQVVHFIVDAPRWAGEDLQGKRILVIGEQGLGDEIMFAGMVQDLIARVGPKGKVMLACDQRLVTLFTRSFPQALVGPQFSGAHQMKNVRFAPWASGENRPDFYTPCGSPLQYLRPSLSTFEPARAFIQPDPNAVAHWKERLKALGTGPYVGLCWRTMYMTTQRRKYFARLIDWAPLLKTPGARFINLQYGDCAGEIEDAHKALGIEVHAFPDLDVKNDLDGNAALCAALDLVASAPTAAAALAAATGQETWFLVAGRTWPQLGTDHYPWYVRSRVIMPEVFGDWTRMLTKAAAALQDFVAKRS